MKGEEFRRIRKFFGLGKADWMYVLGYAGNKNTMYVNCERYENGTKTIPLYLARYVWLMEQWGRAQPPRAPAEAALPAFPVWQGYELEEVRQP
jgi:hypothetical protein